MSKTRRAIEIPDDILERMELEGDLNDIVVSAVLERYERMDDTTKMKRVKLSASESEIGDADFSYPICDVIKYGVYKWDMNNPLPGDGSVPIYVYEPTDGYIHQAEVQLWWCPDSMLDDLEHRCDVWEENGFKLYMGTEGEGADFMPEVIEFDWQERGRNKGYCGNTKMQGAPIGSHLVWLDIVDVDKAYAFMKKRSDIPVPVRVDMIRYTHDEYYKKICDKANRYIMVYFMTGKPVTIL